MSDTRRSVTATPTEARKRNLRFRIPPPENATCTYCGKSLEPIGVVMFGEVFLWKSQPTRCNCEKAKAYWERYDKQEAEKQAKEADAKRRRKMQERMERLLGDSGIKRRFQQRTFANFKCDTPERKSSYSIAKKYADNWQLHQARGDGLYIEGSNGTGKTHLAAAIALQLIGEGIPVICKTSSDMLLDIKKAFDDPELTEHQILDIYRYVDLLIVDDLGKEQCSDWSMSTLYSIFNDRYEDMKPTIITTNYSADDLVRALTPKGYDNAKIVAIISRLREVSQVLTMAWNDCRYKTDEIHN